MIVGFRKGDTSSNTWVANNQTLFASFRGSDANQAIANTHQVKVVSKASGEVKGGKLSEAVIVEEQGVVNVELRVYVESKEEMDGSSKVVGDEGRVSDDGSP